VDLVEHAVVPDTETEYAGLPSERLHARRPRGVLEVLRRRPGRGAHAVGIEVKAAATWRGEYGAELKDGPPDTPGSSTDSNGSSLRALFACTRAQPGHRKGAGYPSQKVDAGM
jgi:hypothetical protein